MFEFIKNLFSTKTADETTIITAPPPPKNAAKKAATQVAEPGVRQNSQSSAQPAVSKPAAPRQSQDSNGKVVRLSLESILNGLPFELRGRVRPTETSTIICLPVDKVISQLAQGAVRISFGELREAAPRAFTSATDGDQTQVPLPLNEILSQINPQSLVRRQNQKQVAVPEEVSSPFADRGQGLAFTATQAKTPETPAPRSITPAAPVQQKAIPQNPIQPRPFQSKPAQPVPEQPAPEIKPIQATPFRSGSFQPPPVRSSITATPTPQVPTATPPNSAPAIPISSAIRNLGATLAPKAAQNTPTQAPHSIQASQPFIQASQPVRFDAPQAQPAKPVAEGALMHASLASLSEAWTEALRQEIEQMNLGDAKLALPADLVEDALKRGRVAFPWKTVRSWISPAASPAASAHDSAIVELPLKVIMPLFLARKKAATTTQQRVAVDQSIPDLFVGIPQPEAAQAPAPATALTPKPVPSQPQPSSNGGTALRAQSNAVAQPLDTNYYIWDESSGAAKADEAELNRPSPGTTFSSRYATPNEVVTRAGALPGVVGVLVALPDGLMVASKLAPDLNGDTLAAFLPHIFGKVSQCTKELRMGELNNLNFTVGNVPWKIFRVNAIFFAAFGRVGEPLPTAQLAALAGELDHKKQ